MRRDPTKEETSPSIAHAVPCKIADDGGNTPIPSKMNPLGVGGRDDPTGGEWWPVQNMILEHLNSMFEVVKVLRRKQDT